jgi:transcription elongation factor Elf1
VSLRTDAHERVRHRLPPAVPLLRRGEGIWCRRGLVSEWNWARAESASKPRCTDRFHCLHNGYERQCYLFECPDCNVAGEIHGYLENKYRNDDGELVCQLCGDPLSRCSFMKRNNEVYFWGGEVISSLERNNAANGLLLCPLCGAKYDVLVRQDDGQLSSVQRQIAKIDPTTIDEENLIIEVDLNGSQGRLRFVQTHWIDLREAVRCELEEGA